jgi:hypothetical protein
VRHWLRGLLPVLASVVLLYTLYAGSARAARRPSHVGTITAISSSALTIHSKTHKTYYHFAINSQTLFLDHGHEVSRNSFKIGTYVTVTYAPGPNNSLIAIHISLRRARK